MARKKAKIGRPPRHGGERLSKSRTFRVRPHLDELLQKAAAEAGRSVSEEIEYRLDRSFYEAAMYRGAFGERTGDLFRAFATAIWLIERGAGKKWHEDRETRFQVARAIDGVTEWFTGRPADPWRAVVELKYPDLNPFTAARDAHFKMLVEAEAKPEALERRQREELSQAATNSAVLRTLQVMGMAPPDAKIDEVAAKMRADPKRLEEQERHLRMLAENWAEFEAHKKSYEGKEPEQK
jgi:hypothetical protein